MGWVVGGSAIAMGALILAGLAFAVVRGLILRRRVKSASRLITPLVEGISAGMRDIDAGVARAQAGADELSREIEELRVSVAELQVIGHHASVAFADLRGPLGWLAGIRALAKFRGR